MERTLAEMEIQWDIFHGDVSTIIIWNSNDTIQLHT